MLQQTAGILERQAKTFADRIAAEVNQKLATAADHAADRISLKFRDANAAAEQARITYERAARLSARRIICISLACFTLGCAGMLAGVGLAVSFILPAPDVIERAREAERVIGLLAPRGGNSLVTTCAQNGNQAARLCVRTDERDNKSILWHGNQGETYRIPYGY